MAEPRSYQHWDRDGYRDQRGGIKGECGGWGRPGVILVSGKRGGKGGAVSEGDKGHIPRKEEKEGGQNSYINWKTKAAGGL